MLYDDFLNFHWQNIAHHFTIFYKLDKLINFQSLNTKSVSFYCNKCCCKILTFLLISATTHRYLTITEIVSQKMKKRYHFYAKITYMARIHLPVIFSYYCALLNTVHILYTNFQLWFTNWHIYVFFRKPPPAFILMGLWATWTPPPPLCGNLQLQPLWAPPSTLFFVWNGNVDTWILF